MSELHTLEVGKPYVAGKTSWPEQVEYNYRGGAHELRAFLRNPSSREMEDLRSGELEFGVAVHGPIIFLLYRAGTTFDWSDAPYTYHMVPHDQQVPPAPLGPADGVLLTVVAVDAGPGIVKVLRVVSLPHTFASTLQSAIVDQMHQPFTQAGYDAALASAYRLYPQTDMLLGQTRARCQIAGRAAHN